MKKIIFSLCILVNIFCYGQDSSIDYSIVNDKSKDLEYLLSLFTIHGIPKNQNSNDTLEILINHGYCLGFSKKNNQALWAAYQVSQSKKDIDYERFPFFVDDIRLNIKNRIGAETFGGGYDLGHLVPNAAINRQYGKLSQMETFLMSNISPQKAGLNQGVWQKLEAEILNKYAYADDSKSNQSHVWILVGPVFGDSPEYITRKNGIKVPIPDAFYCILVRSKNYPYNSPGNSGYLAFLFSQDLEKSQKIDVKFLTSINEIEKRTKLNFFPNLTKTMENKIENAVANELW